MRTTHRAAEVARTVVETAKAWCARQQRAHLVGAAVLCLLCVASLFALWFLGIAVSRGLRPPERTVVLLVVGTVVVIFVTTLRWMYQHTPVDEFVQQQERREQRRRLVELLDDADQIVQRARQKRQAAPAGGQSMRDEHDHQRAFCMCGTLLYDGWLNPDGTAHACKFWPPSNDWAQAPPVPHPLDESRATPKRRRALMAYPPVPKSRGGRFALRFFLLAAWLLLLIVIASMILAATGWKP